MLASQPLLFVVRLVLSLINVQGQNVKAALITNYSQSDFDEAERAYVSLSMFISPLIACLSQV